MKRMRIKHVTGFTYSEPVTVSYNEARMLPTTTPEQFVLSAGLEVSPAGPTNTFIDFFGTHVTSFDVLQPHTELEITAQSLVEVRPPRTGDGDIAWEALAAEADRSVDTAQHLVQTASTQPHTDVRELASELAGRARRPADAALEITRTVAAAIRPPRDDDARHRRADDVWATRRGTGEDIAHVTIGALRSAGIPARYASGYVHPRAGAEVGVPVQTESHAWLEYFVGDWVGFDCLSLGESGDGAITSRHVLVGRGRDYSDVAPLRGVYAGPTQSELHVQVTITREA